MPYKTKKIGFSTLFLKWFLIMKYVQFMDLTLAAIYLFLKIMNQLNFEVCNKKKKSLFISKINFQYKQYCTVLKRHLQDWSLWLKKESHSGFLWENQNRFLMVSASYQNY